MITAEQAAHELTGTCMSLFDLLYRHQAEHLENDSDFCDRLDALTFQCTNCMWWCCHSEMSDDVDWQCRDCAPENEE